MIFLVACKILAFVMFGLGNIAYNTGVFTSIKIQTKITI
jgi:hypothetical protein